MEALDLFLACHQTLVEKLLLLCLLPLLIVVYRCNWNWHQCILKSSLLLEQSLDLVLFFSYFSLLGWRHPRLIDLDRLASLGT
jgi:hypothetical protein